MSVSSRSLACVLLCCLGAVVYAMPQEVHASSYRNCSYEATVAGSEITIQIDDGVKAQHVELTLHATRRIREEGHGGPDCHQVGMSFKAVLDNPEAYIKDFPARGPQKRTQPVHVIVHTQYIAGRGVAKPSMKTLYQRASAKAFIKNQAIFRSATSQLVCDASGRGVLGLGAAAIGTCRWTHHTLTFRSDGGDAHVFTTHDGFESLEGGWVHTAKAARATAGPAQK